jgi:hypothetical protein
VLHDGHVHGSCGDCGSFATVFAPGNGLDAWGFCERQRPQRPSPAIIESLQDAYLAGDRATLRRNAAGIYRAEEDDACDFFRAKVF